MKQLSNSGISSDNTRLLSSKGLKVNLRKGKVMVSGVITEDSLSTSKVNPCGICSLNEKDNSVLHVQCGKWIHDKCAGVKSVIASLQEILHAGNEKEYWKSSGSGRKII